MPSSRTHTEQEQFWAGDFGNAYTDRNAVTAQERRAFFQNILRLAPNVESACELGANKGHNLKAIQQVQPNCQLTGVELNPSALQILKGYTDIAVFEGAIQDFQPNQQFDLVYSCGVLIHINPDDLPNIYEKMLGLSKRYILINEYYNPSPVALNYRGHEEKLFKRDFGGEFWDVAGTKVKLVDYGFLWQRVEPAWDNTTWWLFEKQ